MSVIWFVGSEKVKQGGRKGSRLSRRYHVASADLKCELVDLATGDVLQPLPSKLPTLISILQIALGGRYSRDLFNRHGY